ncbi:MAG: PKD domain-containing protein, partial [Pyrinomonadaceae bacterium]
MSLPAPRSLSEFSLRLTKKAKSFSVVINRKAVTAQLIAVLLIYALSLQLVPRVVLAVRTPTAKTTPSEKRFAENKPTFSGAFKPEADGMSEAGEPLPATITDAVVSRHKPTLNSGRIEGSLRVLLGESFTINGTTQITSDLYLPGTPTIQLDGNAQYGGTVNDGGVASPTNYTVSLSGNIDLPGHIHTNVDPLQLPTRFPASIPGASGTRTVTIHSQSETAGIGNWQTVRDLSVNGSGLTINVPPGNYGTFTVNGNSRLNFSAGTYNFANNFNLDGSASIQATGLVVLNVAQSLTVTSGALVLGSYTSPGDVRLNVLGSSVNINGSSQISALVRADNATATINGTAQVRGQVIANTVTLNGGKVIGSVWPAHSGSSITTFGPRRFDRTTGPPNQYLEQFSLPAGAISPYKLHIQNGSLDGTNRVSSATIKLNGVVILSPSDLNQNVGVVDRTVTLDSTNTLAVTLASDPGSYLIVDIGGAFPPGDTTPPALAITSPANNSTTTDAQITVSGTASDPGPGASGVAQVQVNGQEAAYNSNENTWAITGVALSIGANSIIAQTVDHAGNQTTASITVTRETPNQSPAVNAGADQTFALPQTATLHGTATDDGLPQGSALLTNWSAIGGPGTVTFDDPNALDTSASFISAGTYVLRLTVDDGALSTSDDLTVTVQPQNQPPTVVAGPDQVLALPHSATLNGSATDDGLPDASILAVAWSQVSGPGTATFAETYLTNTLATFSAPGTYVLRLSASDSELSSASELTVTVQPENQAPTVSAGPDQIVALPAYALLNGSVADDGWPAGSSLTETWTVISSPGAANIANPNMTVTPVTFSAAGTYVLRLTVSDGELSNSDEVIITVDPQNQPPVVDAGADQTISIDAEMNLNGVVSDDGWPRNSSVTVSWSQVNGPGLVTFENSAVTTTSVMFSQPGTYVFRLTADDSQLAAADDITIIVNDPRILPVADFVVPESSGTAGSFVIASSTALADRLLDNSTSTIWTTNGINNQFAKLQFFDQESVFIDRVRLQAANGTTAVKDFDVQVSSTNSDDASFLAVLSATYLNNGQLQEFVLPGGPARARYIKFVPRNNYGSTANIQLATFNAVAVGSADSIISLPAQANVALDQSPGLIANGAVIYSSSDPFGSLPPNGLLGYRNGGWAPLKTTNPFAVIQLAGGGLYSVSGIKLATALSSGFGQATSVRSFELWVSATTPDDTSFTRVLTATATFSTQLQTFPFPGGTVAVRYLKYVPLTNNGGATIDTQTLDVISEGAAQVVGASGQNENNLNPAEAAFDSDVNSIWSSQSNAISNVWVKTSLADGLTQKLYGARINPLNDSTNGQRGPKDFDIRVSTTTTNDSAFTTVYSGTLAGTLNGSTQEFLFPNFVEARYVQFFWKNGYSTANIGVRTLEVLAVPTRGSALIAFSTQEDPASNTLDLDPSNQWVTSFNNVTNQWLKLLLPKAEIQSIHHIALRPATSSNHSAPKDFELQVSATDAVDNSFTTVLAGTLVNSTQLQDFYFEPAQARYVRLLLKNGYGTNRLGLAGFYIYSANQIGATARFIDRSTDPDGQIVSWAWNFGDGGTSPEQHPVHTYALPGDYTVSLTVTDNSGLTHTRQLLYHVLDSSGVDFTGSPQIAHEGGDLVRFTDLTKFLVQPTALRQYDFGDGVTLSQALNTSLHTFAENGIYHVTLRLGDPLGVSYTATKDIVVLNVPPAVGIPNGKTVVWGELWTSVPTIADQSVIDRLTLQGQWNFGDGQTAQCVNCTSANATITHAYDNPGTYTVTFAVTDRDGGVGSDSATYVVNKRGTSLAFLANSLQGSGQTFLSRVKLTDSFDNTGIANRNIQFNLNGVTGSALTDATGTAEITLPVSPDANVALMTANWAGDNLYSPSSNTASTTLNFAPTVNAGADQATTLPCVVNLSGSVTDDGVPNGVPLGIAWAKVSGPGIVSFANAGAAQTTATFSAAGKYVLRLSASDTRLSSSDEITITVNLVEVGAAQYFPTTPYFSFADSPLGGRNASYFYLETFEDHLLNTPGVSASAGGVTSVVFGSNLHDSVDADDGVIDGNGLLGDSYISANGAAGIRFTFSAAVLGSLPTHAGLVWTDGAGQVSFEVFDHNGISMGLQGPFNFPDSVNSGTTAEDRFLGAYNKDGISAIRVLNTVGGIEIDHLQYGFSIGNSPPIVNAGTDQNIFLPTSTFTLNGAVSDDGLPVCNTLAISWSLVSGPGSASFANAQAAQTTVTLTTIGQYVLRLTAADAQYTVSDDVVINLLPPNQAPVVNAGDDQTVTLPAAANLQGSASDDGSPLNLLTVSWFKVSGPGSVAFTDANAQATTATFSTAGVYVLRLTATDTALSSSDEVQITVNAAPVNQPPTANAGADQSMALNANLIANGGNEELLINDEIGSWTEVQGANWSKGSAASGTSFPAAQRGASYFYPGNSAQSELRQDIDLSSYVAGIAAGTQQFEFKTYLRSLAEALPDTGRVVLEYRDATNSVVIATLDSGDITSTSDWHLTEDTRIAPAGTGWIRVRLIATRNSNAASDAGNDAFFDSISLRPVGAVAVKLSGVISDDGLPFGSSLAAIWTMVSGPAAVGFGTPNAAVSGASFTTPGTYVLRLTASDGQTNTSDDLTVVVTPANRPPVVNAGANQTITLPATANLSANVTDDGHPAGSSVSIVWSKVSGPGLVTFTDSHQAATTVGFSAVGVYLLRLTADDSEYDAVADVTVIVNPEPTQVNQPPVVSPGTNQTISLPADTVTLNGAVTDDGLPAGSILTVTWTQISGPGIVTFGNANSAVTNAQFSAAGSYALRLTATDGAYTVSADVGVILAPQNFGPTANAGPDQTVLLSQGAQLDGSAGDDGLPNGNLTTNWTKLSGPGAVTFLNPNVTITGALFNATGTYALRLTASDGAFSASDDITITVIDDVPPPTVTIDAPTDGSSVTEPTLVTGSVSNGAWVLEYSLGSDDNTNNRNWTRFAAGNGAISSGQLGTLDPTMMLNGLFDIRLSTSDSYGQTSRTSISVIVERNLKVGNFTVSFSDLNIPVAGVPMEVTRTYDSRDKRVGDFGFGWTLGLHNVRLEKSGALGLRWYETVSQEVAPNYCLEATGSHLVTVTFPGGKVFKFQAAVTPHCQRFAPVTTGTLTFTPLAGTHGTLEVVGLADFQVAGSVPGPVNLVGFGGGVDIFNSALFKFTAEDGTAFVINQHSGLQ